MNLTQIKESWEQDCQIDDLQISSESIRVPKLHSKYLNELVNYKLKQSKHKSDYKLLRKVKFRYYRGDLTKHELEQYGLEQYQGPKHLKNEMAEILDGDEDLIEVLTKIEYCDIVIQTLESIMKSISSRNFEIKNFIDYEKFRSGI